MSAPGSVPSTPTPRPAACRAGPPAKAIVVGGGIAGLASAVALQQAGIEVAVFERAKRIEQVGAGIGLAHNALRCLDRIGVAAEVRARGQSPPRFVNRTWDGELLSVNDWNGVWIHRAELQDVLLSALGQEAIRLESTFAGFTQDASGVSVRFTDGHEERGDVLLGADGIRSAVREQLFGKSAARYTGSIAWRGVTDFEHPELVNNLEFWGLGSRFGVFSLGGGRTYWYGTRRVPEGFVIPPDRRQQELLEHYAGWYDPVTAVIAATARDGIIQTDIYDHRPIHRWGEGRVTLLGDGAHAMTADVGQGCAQVLEDAVVVADCLRTHDDVQRGLRVYEERRIKRANAILRQSHRYSQLGRLENPIACGLRNSLLLKRMPAAMKRRRARRLWGFDYWEADAEPVG